MQRGVVRVSDRVSGIAGEHAPTFMIELERYLAIRAARETGCSALRLNTGCQMDAKWSSNGCQMPECRGFSFEEGSHCLLPHQRAQSQPEFTVPRPSPLKLTRL